MTKVIVGPDQSFENALKRFKKQSEKVDLLSEIRNARERLGPPA